MLYEPVVKKLKEHLFVIVSEKYRNRDNDTFVNRYVAKHPLLRPELIIVNDQIHGFKKQSKRISSLEKFPIYLEIEGYFEEDDFFVDHIDLYAETKINSQERLKDVIFLANQFSEFIELERVICVTDVTKETLVVYSKIQDFFLAEVWQDIQGEIEDLVDEDDIQIENIFVEEADAMEIIETQLKQFTLFIQVLDDLLVKGKTLDSIIKFLSTAHEQ